MHLYNGLRKSVFPTTTSHPSFHKTISLLWVSLPIYPQVVEEDCSSFCLCFAVIFHYLPSTDAIPFLVKLLSLLLHISVNSSQQPLNLQPEVKILPLLCCTFKWSSSYRPVPFLCQNIVFAETGILLSPSYQPFPFLVKVSSLLWCTFHLPPSYWPFPFNGQT